MNIGLDVDGVLADFVHAFTSLGNGVFRTPILTNGAQKSWDWEGHFTKKQVDKLWEIVHNSPEQFWPFLHPLVTEPELQHLKRLAKKHNIFYVTNRWEAERPATLGWLIDNGFPQYWNLIICKDKVEVVREKEIAIFLDDNPKNLDALDALDLMVVARDWPYNRDVVKGIKRVSSVGEFLALCE